MILLLVGPPGAGKGTHARSLQERHGLVHISAGEILRQHALRNDALGREAKPYMTAGQLVPDHLVNAAMFERLAAPDTKAGIVLDGYPRNAAQAESLDRFLAERGQAVDALIELRVDEATMVERITGRCGCGKCGACYHDKFKPPAHEGRCDDCGGHLSRRLDDNETVVRRRLRAYEDSTRPVLGHYEARGVHVAVDSNRSEAEVLAAIEAAAGLGSAGPAAQSRRRPPIGPAR